MNGYGYKKFRLLKYLGILCTEIEFIREDRKHDGISEDLLDGILLEKLKLLANAMIMCKIPFIQIAHMTELHMDLLIELDKDHHKHMGREYVYSWNKYNMEGH